jgi:hypothetical protein
MLIDNLHNSPEKILVQHGQLEYFEVETGKIYFPDFRVKLNSTNKIYVIDNKSEKYFLRYISHPNLTFSLIKSKLILLPWSKSNEILAKVLIVGHENDVELHVALVNRLKASSKFNLAYKLHPLQGSFSNDSDLWIIRKSEQLPMADVVISYGSSLDNEIAQLLPAATFIKYGFNEKFQVSKAVNSIEKKLFNLLRIENSAI